MTTKKNMTYSQYVKRGKELLNGIKCYQAQIAYYATRVCEIKHGGRTKATTYTLTKYAKDIGMNRKTLSEWVSVYRNVITKLGVKLDKLTDKDWSAANRVQSLLKDEKRTVQSLTNNQGKKTTGYKQKIPAARIKDLFKQNYNGPNFQKEVYAYNDYLIFIKNKLIARDLTTVSLSSLVSLKENLDKASDHILTFVTKQATAKELKPKTKVKNTKPKTLTQLQR